MENVPELDLPAVDGYYWKIKLQYDSHLNYAISLIPNDEEKDITRTEYVIAPEGIFTEVSGAMLNTLKNDIENTAYRLKFRVYADQSTVPFVGTYKN